MDNQRIFMNILKTQSIKKNLWSLTVKGYSMFPTLQEGDTVTIIHQSDYDVGDILVFLYKENTLLIHRLIKKDKGIFYCKGDNAFRLEDVTEENIIGKVHLINSCALPRCSKEFIDLSYAVNREFVRLRYDIDRTKRSDVFKKFIKKRMEENNNG